MSEYAGQQFVGIDLHRRRSVIVRTTESGEVLEAVRILNDVERLDRVIARAGEDPEVVLEATYGWYWAVDALQAAGAQRASGAPVGGEGVRVPAGEERLPRRRPTWPICCGWAGCPEAWIAPPATRELRELVRHRAKLVGLRVALQGRGPRGAGQVRDPGADERPVRRRGQRAAGPAPAAGTVCGPDRVAAPADGGPGVRDRPVHRPGPGPAGAPTPATSRCSRSRASARSWARCSSPRSATCTRFGTAPQLACWAGLTPKHHESDTHVHRGRITKQGSRLVRWAAVESVKRLGPSTRVGALRDRVADRRGSNIGAVAAARQQIEYVFYALRDGHVRALQHPPPGRRHETARTTIPGRSRGRAGHDPRHVRSRRGRAF